MKRNTKPLSPAERAKRVGISTEQFEAQARKQADKYFRKQGLLGPELKPDEKLELEKQAKASKAAFEKKFPRNRDWPPFPLPDIYDDDAPELVGAAIEAVRVLRWNYMPGVPFFGKQLKLARDVALDIWRAYPGTYGTDRQLLQVPLAENPADPTEQDFIRLEVWFSATLTAMKAEIAREIAEKPAETKRNAIPMRGRIWICLKKIPRWIYYLLGFFAALLTILHLLGWLGPIKTFIRELVG